MARQPTPEEAGATNLNQEVDYDNLWCGDSTRRNSLHGSRQVGEEVVSVMVDDAHERQNGTVAHDMDIQAQVSRKESRRPVDKIPEDDQSYTTETLEKVNGEIEETLAMQKANHEFTLIKQASEARLRKDADDDEEVPTIEGRAERCRQDVANRTRYYEERGGEPVAVPAEGPHHERQTETTDEYDHGVAVQVVRNEPPTHTTTTFGEVEPETSPEVPQTAISQDQLAEANKAGKRLYNRFCDHYGAETYSRSFYARLVAMNLWNGMDAFDAQEAAIQAVYRFNGVAQPISDIDPFDQYKTTIVARVDQLWEPNDPESQSQVGLVVDQDGSVANSEDKTKLTVWRKAGKKRHMKVGDLVAIEAVKVNAEKFWYGDGDYDYEWRTNLCVDSEAEIHILEHGDGPIIRSQVAQTDPTHPAFSTDSDNHQWLVDMGDNDHKQIGDTPTDMHKIGFGETKTVVKTDDNGTPYFATECEHHRMEMADGPEVTLKQQGRSLPDGTEPSLEEWAEELNIGPEATTECPECGSTHTSSYQQQTGGADEGMTGFHRCEGCGHNWRTGYGA